MLYRVAGLERSVCWCAAHSGLHRLVSGLEIEEEGL